MIRTLALAAVAALSFSAILAGPAVARDRPFVAQLQTPVAERTQVVAQNAVWICEADTCRARVQQAATIPGCRDLVREVGAVRSYGSETAPFSEDRLTTCNIAAPQSAATQSAGN